MKPVPPSFRPAAVRRPNRIRRAGGAINPFAADVTT
jgi:hypothetical protein